MGLFTKPEYKDYMLDFKCAESDIEEEGGVINIEAYGEIMNQKKYCFACYVVPREMYDNGEYDQILNLLKNFDNKKVRVVFKIKDGKLKDFKLDLSSLATAYNDERLNKLELSGWGLNDKNYY